MGSHGITISRRGLTQVVVRGRMHNSPDPAQGLKSRNPILKKTASAGQLTGNLIQSFLNAAQDLLAVGILSPSAKVPC